MSSTEPAASLGTALTQSNGHSRVCANPFCNSPLSALSLRGKHGRYCSARCRMDAYALRRARVLLNRVGIVRFHALLERLTVGADGDK